MRFLRAYKRLTELKKCPPVYYLTGPEKYLREKCLDLVLGKLGITRRSVVEFSSAVKPGEVISEAGQPSIFEPVRVFIYSEVDKTRSQRDLKALRDFLEAGRLPQGHTLILTESSRRRAPKGDFYDYMRDKTEWVECTELRESREEVSKWIWLNLETRGCTLPGEVIRELAETYKKDLHFLDPELEKLVWYPEKVTLEVLQNVGAGSKEGTLQPLFDMISVQNGPKSLQRLNEALESLTLRQVLNGIARFLHHVLVTSGMAKEAASNSEISEALGINPFFVRRLRTAASRFNMFHLTVALNRLAEIDTTLRQEGDSQPLLQNMIYFLCEKPGKLVQRVMDTDRIH